jgi:anti-sigma factor RsiW
MRSDELEHLLMQYIDGSLSPARMQAARRLLETHPDAQAQLELHRRLGKLLSQAAPLPRIRWTALTRQISSAIAASKG